MNEVDPLDEIFVESNEVLDRKIIADILKSMVTIDPKGNLDFSENYDKLTNMKKALVYLVVKKAMKLKGITEEEFASAAETSKGALVSESDTNNAFCTRYKKLLENKRGKGYTIPNHKLKKVREEIFQEQK